METNKFVKVKGIIDRISNIRLKDLKWSSFANEYNARIFEFGIQLSDTDEWFNYSNTDKEQVENLLSTISVGDYVQLELKPNKQGYFKIVNIKHLDFNTLRQAPLNDNYE